MRIELVPETFRFCNELGDGELCCAHRSTPRTCWNIWPAPTTPTLTSQPHHSQTSQHLLTIPASSAFAFPTALPHRPPSNSAPRRNVRTPPSPPTSAPHPARGSCFNSRQPQFIFTHGHSAPSHDGHDGDQQRSDLEHSIRPRPPHYHHQHLPAANRL